MSDTYRVDCKSDSAESGGHWIEDYWDEFPTLAEAQAAVEEQQSQDYVRSGGDEVWEYRIMRRSDWEPVEEAP